jgi:hypothetical protein
MIHRTGKRASHESKEYSLGIEAIETDHKEEEGLEGVDSNDHDVSR